MVWISIPSSEPLFFVEKFAVSFNLWIIQSFLFKSHEAFGVLVLWIGYFLGESFDKFMSSFFILNVTVKVWMIEYDLHLDSSNTISCVSYLAKNFRILWDDADRCYVTENHKISWILLTDNIDYQIHQQFLNPDNLLQLVNWNK